ncbi:MAG: hypothetical protein HY200_01845 [Nitrospirae bacterium]|nr:hypothetical protein [Nitrospirota bacterium]
MDSSKVVRLISVVVLTIFFMMLWVGIYVVNTQKKGYSELLTTQGQTLAGLLAELVPSSLSAGDRPAMDQYLRQVPKERDILYILIENKERPVSWYFNNENSNFSALNPEKEEVRQRIAQFQSAADLTEIRLPVRSANETLGWVKIGLNKKWINQGTTRQIIGVVIIGLLEILMVAVILLYYPYVRKSEHSKVNVRPIIFSPADGSERSGLSNNEIVVLVSSLNKMVNDLKSIITRIGTAVSNVAATSDQLTATSKKLFDGAGIQTQAIEVTSTSLSQMNHSLAGSNNLVGSLYKLSNDTSSSILEMTASIKEMSSLIRILMEAIHTTSSSIEEMSFTVNGIADSISILLVSAEETSASLNEINATIKTVEVSTKEATRLSKSVTSDASSLGMRAVKKTIEGMNKIREDVKTSSVIINDLANKSLEIGKILTVIEEVTRQTNLLALNSAILAAQAGEGGKGFAVVSDEIKHMADQTALSTKEIAEIISSIQSGITNAIESMKKGMATVEDGVQVSQEAFVALETIGESSDQSFKMISEIERAMKEQAIGIRQVDEATVRITGTLKQIKNSTQEHKKGTSLIVSAVQKMQSTAEQVNRAITEQTKGAQLINDAVATVQEKTREVLNSAEEQKVAGDKIVSSVSEIGSITSQNATLSSEVNSAVKSLVNEAELLKNEVSRFKVSSETNS